MNTMAKEAKACWMPIEKHDFDLDRSKFSIGEALDKISESFGYICAVAILALVLMINFEVISRYIFNTPTTWVTEFSLYVFIGTSFIGAAYANFTDSHIRVEVLLNALSKRHKEQLLQISAWVGFLFVLIAAWQMIIFVNSEYRNGIKAWGLISTPLWIPEASIAIGLAFLCLAILSEISKLKPQNNRRQQLVTFGLLLALVGLLIGIGSSPPRIAGTSLDWGVASIVLGLVLSSWVLSGPRIAFIFLGIILSCGLIFIWGAKMPPLIQGSIMALTLLALMGIGVRIAFALGLVGALSVLFFLPIPQPIILAQRAWTSVNSFSFTAVPMFILMGAILLRSGVSTNLFDVMQKWIGRLPGGLAHATVVACGIFAAVSGSSLATAATMGITAAPEMTKTGYSPRLAFGVVAAGGTLGILIPPSIAMIIYGSLVGVPVGSLFIAGIIPGAILMLAFMAVVAVWAIVRPEAAPKAQKFLWREKFSSLFGVFPFVVLIFGVLGSLYFGVATPTEAGALGVLLSAILCLVQKKLTFQVMKESLLETSRVTSFILIIVFASSIMGYTFDYIRLPKILVAAIQGGNLTPGMIMGILVVVYIILGMFIEPISMILMTWSVSVPVVLSVGLNPVWFGVFLVMMIEIGLVTPPVGVILFVLKGMSPDTSLKEIIMGALPFVCIFLVVIFLLFVCPEIVLWLPEKMGGIQ